MVESKPKSKSAGFAKERRTSLIKLIKQAAYSKSEREVFSDFIEMAAISIANSLPHSCRESKEKRYFDIINAYEKRHQMILFDMFKELVLLLDEHARAGGPEDVLGPIFHELCINSSRSSQFFTPQNAANMIGAMTCGVDDLSKFIRKQGYVHIQEPACGSGVMITGICAAMMQKEHNYNNELLVEATDIDIRCVYMTYIQLSLYGVPAIVIHGNVLSCETWSRWYTPFYVLNRWDLKLKARKLFA